MLEPEERQRDPEHEVEDHHEVADVFVVDHDVDEHRRRAEDPVRDESDAEEGLEVEAELEAVLPLSAWRTMPEAKSDGDEDRLHRHEGDELRREDDPAGDGESVEDRGEARVALAPNELAGVERDDDENEEPEPAELLEDLVGHEPRLRAEDLVGVQA